MSTKGSSNLPAPVITTLAITSADSASIMEKMRAAHPEGFNMLNLDKISFPTAGALTYNVPTEDGQSPERIIDAILVHQHPARQRYSVVYDPALPTPPICVSYDGIRGHGEPGGNCRTCRFYKGGSNAECKPYQWLYLLFSDGLFPTFFPLPRTSLSKNITNGIANYATKLAKGGLEKVKGGLWPWEVVTRIGLAKRERGVGMVATFTEGPRLPEALRGVVENYVKDFRESLTFPDDPTVLAHE